MSTALLIRHRNPDDDFVLHGGPPPAYTTRTSFYPTNSDITTTTRNLSQHEYRADLYRDILYDDDNLRGSLRSASRNLRQVSEDIRRNLEEESTAKRYPALLATQQRLRESAEALRASRANRAWLSDSEWNTTAGHHVRYTPGKGADTTLLHAKPSLTMTSFNARPERTRKEVEDLRRTVDVTTGLAEVPLTRFTSKDLMASEFFPVTMSCSQESLASSSRARSRTRTPENMIRTVRPRSRTRSAERLASSVRARSRTRSADRLTRSARTRSRTPEKSLSSDNFQSMKRLEKLYLVTSEAPATEESSSDDDAASEDIECHVVQTLRATVDHLTHAVSCRLATAPVSILSPYQQDMARLRMDRLRLEEEHLNELSRLATLEKFRGPTPKWYELKDSQFHFEASKNNDLLRSLHRWNAALKSRSQELSRSRQSLDLSYRAASVS